MRILVEGFNIDYPYFWLEVGEPEVEEQPFQWAGKNWAIAQAQKQGYKPRLPVKTQASDARVRYRQKAAKKIQEEQ